MSAIKLLGKRALAATFLLCAITAAAAAAGNVTLSWDANTETDLAGYKLYYGTATGVYSTTINTGNVTTYTISSLPAGTYYFAVKAYNASGLESGYSNEVSTTIAGASVCKCDTNSDSGTNVLDLQIMVNTILGTSTVTSGTGDLNSDSKIDVLDLQILTNVILGLRSCPS
jgi:hypothetical protein